MTTGITTTAQVINPQVMADMVSAKLRCLLKIVIYSIYLVKILLINRVLKP
ncbi:hypothetical protein [Streptococcus vestibularis]|uniref:Uncharacterized protein n=1 Tax=Streptococcus vestibularis TaxID=1343 RepID=A0A564TF05_STRVE|nr:hypothetical protein [Streptococcus vestibularis]VUX06067.1 Uncharacterised protein [Streptococcus vestibularis]